VAADEEAAELRRAAGGDPDRLAELVGRRCQGEPLAWVVGTTRFCGEDVAVGRGVYVPRWQTEPLATAAADRLPGDGVAVDLCTGSGAVAMVLGRRRPQATVVATDVDPLAVACARDNGVDAYRADLMAAGGGLPGALAADLAGRVDVVTGVVPYVPTDELRWLPRDVLAHEPAAALDGGDGGLRYLVRAVAVAAALLRPGGWVLLELGGDQADRLAPALATHGYGAVEVLHDDDGDVRGIAAQAAPRASAAQAPGSPRPGDNRS